MGDERNGQPDGAADNSGSSVPKIVPAVSSGEPRSEAAPTVPEEAIGKLIDERLNRRFQELEQQIEPRVKKEVQSQNDRRWSNLGNLSAAEIKAVADLVKKHGGDVDAAEDELALKSLLDERKAGRVVSAPESQPAKVSAPVPDRTGEELIAKAAKALEPFNLPEETQAMIKAEWGKKTYTSFDEALLGLNAIIANPPKPPSGAGVIAPSGTSVGETHLTGSTEKAAAIGQLYARLDEYFKAPSKHAAEIAATKTRLRELGEDV
jgi:hypothetical protein